MNCKNCCYCKQHGRQQSQQFRIGRKHYWCEHPEVKNIKDKHGNPQWNFIDFGDVTIESPLVLKTAKRWCPLKKEVKA